MQGVQGDSDSGSSSWGLSHEQPPGLDSELPLNWGVPEPPWDLLGSSPLSPPPSPRGATSSLGCPPPLKKK